MTTESGEGGLYRIRRALVIGEIQLRRLARQRLNVFWLVIAPLLFVFVLGVLLGGGQTPRLGVLDNDRDPVAQRLAAALAADGRFEVVAHADPDELRNDVEQGTVHAGLVMPDDLLHALENDRQLTVTLLARPQDPRAVELTVWVEAALQQQGSLLRAARFAAGEGAGTLLDNLDRAATMDTPGVQVVTRTTGTASFPEGLNPFAMMAPSLLLMYIFLTSLTASLQMITSRRRGITTALYATPTPVASIVAGEALGRLGIALAQGLIVMVGSALFFGVNWGDPRGAGLLLLLFCLVGSGTAMLAGSALRTEGPAMGVAIGLGLGLAALGGVMVPLEMLGDTAQTIALATPHAWAYSGFSALVRHGGTVGDILPQLGVLAGFAAVLFSLGIWHFRRTIVK